MFAAAVVDGEDDAIEGALETGQGEGLGEGRGDVLGAVAEDAAAPGAQDHAAVAMVARRGEDELGAAIEGAADGRRRGALLAAGFASVGRRGGEEGEVSINPWGGRGGIKRVQ